MKSFSLFPVIASSLLEQMCCGNVSLRYIPTLKRKFGVNVSAEQILALLAPNKKRAVNFNNAPNKL